MVMTAIGDYIFLLCSERSGSNFLTKLINNHSQICGPATKHLFNPVARNYFRYSPFEDCSRWEDLVEDILNLYDADFSHWNSKFSRAELLSNVEVGDIAGLVAYFFKKETASFNKEICFIKEIKVYEFYPFLKRFFDTIKFVYQVRDPRDMALSWKKSPIHKGGVVQAAQQWKSDQQQYLKIMELERAENKIAVTKYEDLLAHPKQTLESVLKLVGCEYEAGMLDSNSNSLTTKNAQSQQAWENLSKPILIDNFNKFKTELTEKEIKIVERICYFEMHVLKYEPLFQWQELEAISEMGIASHKSEEHSKIQYEPVKGVIENMRAKQRFYQYTK